MLEHADKSLRRRPRARGRAHRAVRRRGARARRRERRRQVDARQDPRRRPPARARPAAARRRGGDLRRRQAVAGGRDRDHLPGADALPRPERRGEHLHRRRSRCKRGHRIDRRRMRRDAAALFQQLGVRVDPDRLARGLSIADQQLVEIAKALTAQRARDRDGRADGGARRRPRSSGCSGSPRRCARAAPRSSSSRTGSRRCSRSASASR